MKLLTSPVTQQGAVDFNCNSSEGHKWYAIVVGSRSEYVGTKVSTFLLLKIDAGFILLQAW